MITTISDKKLKNLVKESVREVLGAELMKLRALALPEVSVKEQKDIERRYHRPSRRHAKSFVIKI